tara:strand:+ start:1607 stop:2509 length:903 start_codon:yes stop_codon:yes gene_type:complete
MAVSGSTDFELDVAEYVEEAFERCGLEVRTGYDLTSARRSLNLLFADWANRGLNRWTIEQATLPLASGIAIYPAGTLTMTVAASGSFSVGETITGGTSGATASITSIRSSTAIDITVPEGTFSASETITGGTSSATTTVSSAVSLVPIQSTIDVLSAVIRTGTGSDQTDVAISRISRDAYINISNKNSTSRPTQFYVDRLITPEIKLWPTPNNNTYTLVYDKLTRIDDVDNPQNTVDVPFRFYPCLSAGLAYYISLKRAPQRTQLLKAVYEEEFERAAAEDRDRASLSLTPSRDYYTFIR